MEPDVVDPGAPPEHLVILCHGLGGTPGSVARLSDALHAAHGHNKRLLLHKSIANCGLVGSWFTTTTGVAAGGEKLAGEIRSLVGQYPSLRRISLVGFSLGGLYIRAAAPLIEGLGLQPVNFVAVASPHAGVRGHLLPVVQAAISAGVLSETGYNLLLLDASGQDGRPLLAWMADPASPHWRALSRYPNRVVAANTVGDDKVPFWSAALAAAPPVLAGISAAEARLVRCHYQRTRPRAGSCNVPPPDVAGAAQLQQSGRGVAPGAPRDETIDVSSSSSSSSADGLTTARAASVSSKHGGETFMRRLQLPSATSVPGHISLPELSDLSAVTNPIDAKTAPAQAAAPPPQPAVGAPRVDTGSPGARNIPAALGSVVSLFSTAAVTVAGAVEARTGLLTTLSTATGLQLRFGAAATRPTASSLAASAATPQSTSPLSEDPVPMDAYPHITAVYQQPAAQHEAHSPALRAHALAPTSVPAGLQLSAEAAAAEDVPVNDAGPTLTSSSVPPAQPLPPSQALTRMHALMPFAGVPVLHRGRQHGSDASESSSRTRASSSSAASAGALHGSEGSVSAVGVDAAAAGTATAALVNPSSATASSSANVVPTGTGIACLPPEETAIICGLRSMGGWVNVDVTFHEPFLPGVPSSNAMVNHLRIVGAKPALTGIGGDVTQFLAAHCFIP